MPNEKPSKEKLKPCPFCGGEPETYWDYEPEVFGLIVEEYCEGFNIRCCQSRVYSIFKSDATEKWNTRVSDES